MIPDHYDAATGAKSKGADQDIPFIAFLNVVLGARKLILVVAVGITVLAVGAVLIFGGYEATAVFAPATGSQSDLGGLAGLAVRFGVNVGGDITSSSGFYANLAQSDALLTQVVQTRFTFVTEPGGRDTMAGSPLEIYQPWGSTPARQLQRAVDKLRKHTAVTVDLESGTVRLTARAQWSGLAEQINRRILDLVNAFNVDQLQSQARSERQFTEQRVQAAQKELEQAEDSLQTFLVANRTYQDSPRLTFEASRLQRRVDLRQQVYVQLVGSYEQARISEIRNTPVITVVDPPEGSGRPRFSMGMTVGVSFLAGLAIGVLFAFLREYFRSLQHERPQEYLVFQALAKDSLRDLLVRGRRRALRQG